MSAVRTFHHSQFTAERLATGREASISVIVPARECAATIGDIARALVRLRELGAVDQVLVVDGDSRDGTGAVAAAEGAQVVAESALLPQFGPVAGKGDAMWRALAVAEGELICFLDGDSGEFGEHFACGTLGPLLFEPDVAFVKAYFRRPFKSGDTVLHEGGGRVTELIARPLLRRFWPELAGVHQPLAGEMAARRDLLVRVPFSVGYAVETALLLDVHREVGAARIAQVDLDVRHNDHKPLPQLAPMADEVLAAASVRLAREERLAEADGGDGPVERPPMAEVLAAA